MKRMTHKTLMKKVDEGRAEVGAWDRVGPDNDCCAFVQVLLYGRDGRFTNETVEITNMPVKE
jgi:hypothetical protein